MRVRRASRTPVEPAVSDAWHMVSLVVEWTKHADTKAGATLAGAAALGGLLYTLVDREPRPSMAFLGAVVVCAVAVVATAVAATMALRPRIRPSSVASQPVFHFGVAQRFADSDGYGREFATLTSDRHALLMALSEVVWNGAVVATRKYRVVRWAVLGLAASVISLATAAVLSRIS
ncbi:Pycsar system effector family protein [Nucisporomicrobium flavum]|uniref:Pycsar system effector family protein n=1 Tax=Nucisporomicrobium flavum TaxID=2785915 RepID=UPI003C2DFC5D